MNFNHEYTYELVSFAIIPIFGTLFSSWWPKFFYVAFFPIALFFLFASIEVLLFNQLIPNYFNVKLQLAPEI